MIAAMNERYCHDGNTFAGNGPPPAQFDPQAWLSALTGVGGGYALMADRRLTFVVDSCDDEALTPIMAQIIGQPDRQELVKAAIERRQCGEGA